MSDSADATAGSAAIPVTDALGSVGAALEQLAHAAREFVVALWQAAAGAGQVIIQQPTTLIAGIAIGLLVAILARISHTHPSFWLGRIGVGFMQSMRARLATR